MIDAYAATTIAYEIEGELIHDHHAQDVMDALWEQANDESVASGGRRYDWDAEQRFLELKEEAGYRSVSRFEIDMMESSAAEDLRHSLFEVFTPEDIVNMIRGALRDGDTDWDGDEVTVKLTFDVSPVVEVTCDQCGERIE